MLHVFVAENREALTVLARQRVAARSHPTPSVTELENGVPVFLDQLALILRLTSEGEALDSQALRETAARHGHDLFRLGLSIEQVVHDYGDVCQSITQLIMQTGVAVETADFKTLNLCLDLAIAGAVSEYARRRERSIAARGNHRLDVLAHELRSSLDVALLAFEGVKSGLVAPGGSTSMLLGRSLASLQDLIDRALARMHSESGSELRELISVASLVEQVESDAVVRAQSLGLHFVLEPVEDGVAVEGDPATLTSALANLLENAFTFTRKRSTVSLLTTVTSTRVRFEVEDECGGIAADKLSELTRLLAAPERRATAQQRGLSVCLKAADESGGTLAVRNLDNRGCVFALDLPRARLPSPFLSVIEGGLSESSEPSDKLS